MTSKIPKQQLGYEILINLDRSNATFKPDQIVVGHVILMTKDQKPFKIDVQSLTLRITGGAKIQEKYKSQQLQIVKQNAKSLNIIDIDLQIAKDKTITQESKLNFRFKLQKKQHKFLETYLGVYINISYQIKAIAKTKNSIFEGETPFYIQVPKAGRQAIQQFKYPKKKHFMIKSEDIKSDKIANFKIRGQLDSQILYFAQDLSGFFTIDYAQTPIRSIDVQMLRFEKIKTENHKFEQKTEIQMIQLCDGNVTRNLQIPIYMILPRFYSCPSLRYQWCQLDFQINFQIIFKDGFKVISNIPLKLIRS